MEEAVVAWREARRLAGQMEEVTRELGKSIAEERIDELAPLLEKRQEICDQLDRLRSEGRIISWTEGEALSPEIKIISREIRKIFHNLVSADEKMRQILLEKMAAVKGNLEKVRQLRQAQRAYVGKSGSLYGAFIDNKL